MVYSQVPADDDDTDDEIELADLTTQDALDEAQSEDEDEDDEEEEEEDRNNLKKARQQGQSRLPDLALLEEHLLWGVWNRWEEPCLLSVGITATLVVPLLLGWSAFVYYTFTGRFWSIWPFILHLQFRLATAAWYIKSTTTVGFSHRTLLRIFCSLLTILEVVLCGLVYPKIASGVMEALFRDVDGGWVYEWKDQVRILKVFRVIGWMIVVLRFVVGLAALSVRGAKYLSHEYREWRPTFMEQDTLADVTHRRLHRVFYVGNLTVLAIHVICILSAVSHFGPWPLATLPQDCDDLDETECALPFPSFHHMRPDPTTVTGWRVDLKGLPPLRGGIPFHPTFLNEDLDGFSTMAPILFYMEGLKEAHENNIDNRVELQGPERIEYSITENSITLLLNVDKGILVPHSAEIDYLDPDRPLVMVIPARPLHHATHYAVVVQKAADQNGKRFPSTTGMKALLQSTNSERRTRYMNQVIPSLKVAADWMASDTRSVAQDLEDIQLLFDFVTASADTQIGKTRAVRDATMAHLDHNSWKWRDHVEVLKEEEHSCIDDGALIARTLHLQIDVPWFLKHVSSRASALDPRALDHPQSLRLGQAKAILRIPCSVQKAALGQKDGRRVRAIMEYGHGLFYHRGEIREHFLSQMANKNGYLLFALDWRGMSVFDLPIVIRTLVGSPNLFRSVRDNLIQGLANKLAFQHFCQNGLLEWLRIGGSTLPTFRQKTPVSVFYGISQGGILGGGYMALAGATKLIDRGVLGVPGTPFALVMTRSLDFFGYDKLMLLNFYNNRHVRILLSLVQMGWDSVEASGLLAEPLSEPLPRVLLQAGLGDPVVPTIAAEALARAMHGATLPSNPRAIYGVGTQPAASNATWNGPNVTLTELLYEKEYSSLPLNDVRAPDNLVHLCVRLDSAFIYQIEEFTNSGKVVDPCVEDECRRISADCF